MALGRNMAIIGLQYGDEGKGKVSSCFTEYFNWYVRFNGGPNAGHTVVTDNDVVYKLHHLPAGGLMGGCYCVLDAGMVIDVNILAKEIAKIPYLTLYVSEQAHMIGKNHLERDSAGSNVGSTKKGIGPAYADKYQRTGVRVSDMKDIFVLRINDILEKEGICLESHGLRLEFFKGLPPAPRYSNLLYEGAQGIMIDIDYGHYPFVTSSSVMPPCNRDINTILGVMKAYTTRVGEGPPNFPDNEALREAGNEYGTTTGRPRRCTWIDLDEIDYAVGIVRPTEIAITKVDILQKLGEYKVWKNGKLVEFPNLKEFLTFLHKRYPEIKYLSTSPKPRLHYFWGFVNAL